MFFISCKTTKVVEKTIIYIPEINWPEFPELGEYEVNNGKVTTDENYFRRLLMFREMYFTERDTYNEKKAKLEEDKNEL